MLARYLANNLRSWRAELERPLRAEADIREDVARFEDFRQEITLMRKLGTRPMLGLLKAECRITFTTLEITVGANYREGADTNVIQIFDEHGLLRYRKPFTNDGIYQAFDLVEADVLKRLKLEYP